MTGAPRARWRRLAFVTTTAVAALAIAGGPVVAEEEGGERNLPIDFVHNNLQEAPVAGGVWGSGPALKNGQAICTTAPTTDANVNLSCEGTGPHNETTIAVNPTDPDNMIAGANDYQLAINPGGHVTASTLSRATVTFDGGATWTAYPIRANSTYQATGDPAVAFDDAGNAYYATLGFRFVGPANAQNPDILVSSSHDGGVSWNSKRVAAGSGNNTSVGDLLDKEYVAAWGDGNAIVTWGDFRLVQKGAVESVKLYASVTHDAGATWSKPQPISGDRQFAFAPIPTVGADGRIFVAFENFPPTRANGRDDYEVVEVDPDTGALVAGPFTVATLVDGLTDYPLAFGRQTYQDSLFRSWSLGNITADPTDADHLVVEWSDMRNSTLPAPEDPYEAVTNSDMVLSQSFDAGRTWSDPVAIDLPGDQFQGWAAFDTAGLVRLGFFDRSYDAANHAYGYTLATETSAGSLAFAMTELTTERSDPTKDNRWFAATAEPDFPFATTFIGDYSGIAATPSGGVVAVWTDLRNDVTFAGRTGADEDMVFAASP
jgi:hypothetical protein